MKRKFRRMFKTKRSQLLVIVIILFAIAVLGIAWILKDIFGNSYGIPIVQNMQSVFNKNDEIVIRIDGTDIDNLVMQADDNDYYLRRNEQGEPDIWGCYFIDKDCTLRSDNIVIYGHCELDDDPNGKRFSQLKLFAQEEFAKEYDTVEIVANNNTTVFKVVSAGTIDAYDESSEIYIKANLSLKEKTTVLEEAKDRSIVTFSDVENVKQILSLVTCTADSSQRFMVVAVR